MSTFQIPCVHKSSFFQDSSWLSVRTRCGFQKSEILRSGSVRFEENGNLIYGAVRFGVLRYRKSLGAVWRCGTCTVWFGSVRF